MNVRHERSKMLRILSEKKKRAFYESQVGKEKTVLWEAEKHGKSMHGFTENYVKVKTPYDETLINTFSKVQLEEIDRDGVIKSKILELAEA
jgi:threonylcarbamoyladenosine tRNA methylthiotransferase MtaB